MIAEHSDGDLRRKLDLGPIAAETLGNLLMDAQGLSRGLDGRGERGRIKRFSQHVWCVDSRQRSLDLDIGEPGDEDRGKIPARCDQSALQFPAPDLRQPQIENEAGFFRVDVAGKERGCRGEGKHLVAADLGPTRKRTARGRVVLDDDELADDGQGRRIGGGDA